MARQLPWDDIPDSNVFPTGTYHVQGVKLEETQTSTGKLMYSMEAVVVDHPKTAPYTNMHYFENFVIGSDDDPDATVAGTWAQSFGAKRLKQLVAAAQIAEKHNMEKIQAGFAGTQFLIGLLAFKEPEKDRDGNPNAYAGQERNKLTGFYKLGQKEPELAAKTGAKPGPVAAPQAPPVAAPQFVQPAAPQFQPAPTQMAPAPQPSFVPPPPTQAPPVAQANPAPQPAATGQMLPCNICGQMVQAAQFANHINACLANQQAR